LSDPAIFNEKNAPFPYESGLPCPYREKAHFRGATYNIQLGEKAEEIAEAIESNKNLQNCDTIFLQEVEAHFGKVPFARIIAENCRFNCVYIAARGEPHNYAKGICGTHGLALLTQHRVENLEEIVLPVYDLGTKTRRRICMTCKVMHPNGKFVRTYNMHLDTRMDTRFRINQLAAAVRHANQFRQERILLGGDLNITNFHGWKLKWIPTRFGSQRFGQDGIDTYMEKSGFAHPDFTKSDFSMPLGRQLPDALYSKNMEFVCWGIEHKIKSNGGRISDHDPIWADLAW